MAVAILFTASCAKEDISSSIVGGGEVEVTFSANLPELGTRANTYGNGANADILYYNVYEAGSDNQLGDLCGSVESNTGTFTFSLVLLKGMEYDLVFWAQDKDCGYYSLNGKQITVDYTDVDANDDTRDAFFRYVEGFDPTSDTPSFKLYRPFAQLNAAVSAADMTAVGKNEVTLTTSTVTVDTYTGFDISTGDVIGNKSNVTFKATTMPCNLAPAEELKADYTYVSMNYLLVPKIGMVSNVIYTFNATKNGGNFAFTGTSYNDVPLKQNFRTNILGALLTAPTQFTVEIEAGFNEPAEEVVVDAASLIDAINNAPAGEQTQITLGGDIDLNDLLGLFSTRADEPTYGILIPAGKDIVLNLEDGAVLRQSKKQTAAYSMIQNNGTLTIKGNGTISYTDTGNGGEYVSNTILNSGTLTIENCTIENNSSDDVANNGYPHVIDNNVNLTINGGTLTNNTDYSSVRIWCTTDDNTEVTINGGTFNGCIDLHNVSANANKGTLTINGGTFNADNYTKCATRLLGFGLDVDEFTANIYGGTFNGDIKLRNYVGSGEFNSNVYTVYGGTFSTDPSAYVAEGCAIVEENGVYTVSTLIAEVADVKYSNLADAIAAAKEINGTVKLLADITTTDKFVFKKGCDVTIDLNGKTLAGQSSTTGTNYNFLDANGGTLTVKNGTITAEFKGANMGWNNSTNIFNITAGGVLNLADVTAKNLGGSDMGFVAHLNNWGEVTLNVENSTLEANYVAVRAFNSGNDKNNITINNSTLKGGNYAFWVHNFTKVDFGTEEKMIAHYNLLNLNMFNNGNTFVGKNDTPIRLGFTDSVYCAADVNHIVATPESLNAALKAGGNIALANNITFTESISLINAPIFVIEGNNFTISQAENCNNTYALFDSINKVATIKNVVFDGLKGGAVLRSIGGEVNIDNITVQNCEHTQVQGLLRLLGKSTITNSTFVNNNCSMVISINYDGANNDPQVVDNCVFENNVCGATAVLYYVKGAGATVNGNKFIGNTVNCETNGATVYMGFQENCVITNNLFKNNTVNEAKTSRRVAGALMIGYAAEITGNAFIGNKVTGERAVANNVCASAYYTDIDLSGNYWGGLAPKENDDYFNEYPNKYKVIVNDYLSSYIE